MNKEVTKVVKLNVVTKFVAKYNTIKIHVRHIVINCNTLHLCIYRHSTINAEMTKTIIRCVPPPPQSFF